MDHAMHSTRYSRNASTDIFGKLDDHLPEIRVPHQVLEDATARACELGLTLTNYLRQNLYASLYGPEHIGSLHARLACSVLGNALREDGTAAHQ